MNKQIITILVSLITFSFYGQEVSKDTIDTEEINIIKPYTPKIKDAFKIKKSPQIGDDSLNEKKEVKYAINSVPVASTFTPAKGKAKGVSRKQKERIYDNYASVAFGNYTTPKIELFAHSSTTRDNDFGATLNFHSSKGDVKDVVLNNNFAKANLDLFYKNSLRDMDWQVNTGYQYQQQNWYGLFDNGSLLSQTQIDGIDEKQVYNSFKIGGNIAYYDSFFKGIKTDINIFTDAYKSSEIHFLATPKFQFPLSTEWLDTDIRLEYVSGTFKNDYFTNTAQKYGFYNFGLMPNFKVLRDYLTINLGANLVYSGATQNNGVSKFFIYPNVSASYELIQDVITLYANVTGDLHQQTYRGFVAENPFVSPTLNVGRTNEKYNAKIGTKGKMTSRLSFNINASYKDENAKALFKLNEDLSNTATPNDYQFANAFGIVYDNVKTLGFFGELTLDLSKELSLGGNLNFNSYDTDLQQKAWNLPALKGSVFGNYNTNKWAIGANLFYVGERDDQYIDNMRFLPVVNDITAKSYVDFNLNIGYNFTDRLTAFIHGNNLLGTNYEKYNHYKVQGIQVLGGLKYKFDL